MISVLELQLVHTVDTDETKLSCLVCSHVHTANSTRQDSLVRVGGVNKPLQNQGCLPSPQLSSVEGIWGFLLSHTIRFNVLYFGQSFFLNF